eukprot:75144-Pleurochrysis_carterae.AAC.2
MEDPAYSRAWPEQKRQSAGEQVISVILMTVILVSTVCFVLESEVQTNGMASWTRVVMLRAGQHGLPKERPRLLHDLHKDATAVCVRFGHTYSVPASAFCRRRASLSAAPSSPPSAQAVALVSALPSAPLPRRLVQLFERILLVILVLHAAALPPSSLPPSRLSACLWAHVAMYTHARARSRVHT